MSYIMNTGPGTDSRRRRMLLSAVAIGVVALLVAAFLMGRQHTRPTGEPGFAPSPVTGQAITWARLGPQLVPVSPTHGPADTGHGLAAGFSRDELGAVLAAINISVRLSGQVGPAVSETTAQLQCVGDIDAAIAAIRGQRSTAVAGSTIPSEYFYRIASDDPSGDLLVVSIAATTPQSSSLGGYTAASRTLQWIDGDWKLHVPPAPPRLITSVDGWTSLGTVPDA